MTVENTSVINWLGKDDSEGLVYLASADHLEWGASINAYIPAVENGDIYEGRENWRSLPVETRVFVLHQPSEEALQFYDRARDFLASAGLGLSVVHRPDPSLYVR